MNKQTLYKYIKDYYSFVEERYKPRHLYTYQGDDYKVLAYMWENLSSAVSYFNDLDSYAFNLAIDKVVLGAVELARTENIFDVAYSIMLNRNSDYSNNKDALSNFLAMKKIGKKPYDAFASLLVVKLERMENIIDKQGYNPSNERPEDTVRDIVNYCALWRAYSNHYVMHEERNVAPLNKE